MGYQKNNHSSNASHKKKDYDNKRSIRTNSYRGEKEVDRYAANKEQKAGNRYTSSKDNYSNGSRNEAKKSNFNPKERNNRSKDSAYNAEARTRNSSVSNSHRRERYPNKGISKSNRNPDYLNGFNQRRIPDQFASPTSESFSSQPPDDMLWGRHATEAALTSGRSIHRIWCTQELRSSSRFFQLLKDSKSSGVLVEEVSWSRLGQLTKGAVHQGIVLQIAASKTLELKKLIEACKPLGDSSLLLALDGLTDPQNLGAIVRSAEALGAHGLVLPQRRSAGLTGSVAKVAAGALEHLPVSRVVNLNRSLEHLKDSGYRVIGLAEEGSMTLTEVDLDGPLVVVTGSEDKGISLITRRICDQLVRIPMRGVTTSLNASVATSIFLYEVARRRWMSSISGQAPSPRLLKPQFPFTEDLI